MRGGRPIRALALAGALLLSAAAPVGAQSPAGRQGQLAVLRDYATDGRLDACKHSEASLRLALRSLGPAVVKIAGSYPKALRAAVRAHERGACDSGGAAAPATTAAPTATVTATATATATPEPSATTAAAAPPPATPTPIPTPAPAPVATVAAAGGSSGDASVPLLVVGGLAAAAALAVALFALLRRLGVADDRLAAVGHSWREARWRAGGTWQDFRDWLRTGR